VLPVLRRIRDREHVKSVAKQPCLVCGRRPTDAHHLHRCGDEAAWWNNMGIDPTEAARVLWLKTHPLLSTTDQSRARLLETRTGAVAPVLDTKPG
jgi:hypothetical protein